MASIGWATPRSVLLLMKKEKEETKVNSFVSDHPWCTEKGSLTGGGRLWQNVAKLNKLKLS